MNALVPAVIESEAIKRLCLDLGFDQAGICQAQAPRHHYAYREWLEKGYAGEMDYLHRHLELKSHPNQLLPSVQSVIAVALSYNQPNPPVPGKPRIARYALGRDYHKVLRKKLEKLADQLSALSPEAEFRICVDSAPIMERDFANLAGIGWFGKNTMLINSQRGSWFFIGLLLTSLDLIPDSPAIGGCGTCRACIEACPTGAIVYEDDRWQVDARRCISYLTIEKRGEIETDLASRMGDWTFGCDVCQEVCPFNQPRESQPLRAQLTKEGDFLSRRDLPALNRCEEISQEEWDQISAGSPIRRTGLDGLKRNVAINLMNAEPAEKPKT
ncbi:MAG TPA: tRNA epoxyqueuosine(34) reductase QueG [Fimbriimonadaceae bacterium]|nr:tRNA epoxyqueuosine(34) reductase QueG [Fimbriimonadaceae bacterium]